MATAEAGGSNPEGAAAGDLAERYRSVFGFEDERFAAVVERDRRYAASFVALAEQAAAGPITRRVRTLVLLACDASVTYRNSESLAGRIRAALAAGVPPDGVLEVLELVSVLGIHALNVGVPIAISEFGGGGSAGASPRSTAAIRDRFERQRGYWDDGWLPVLQHAPEFLDRYTDFSSAAGRIGVLDAKTRELVLIAIDAAATHLYAPGIRIHVRNARRQGASVDEVLQVFQLLSLMGIESAMLGVPMIGRRLMLDNETLGS